MDTYYMHRIMDFDPGTPERAACALADVRAGLADGELRGYMARWIDKTPNVPRPNGDKSSFEPDCGTSCCIAGWTNTFYLRTKEDRTPLWRLMYYWGRTMDTQSGSAERAEADEEVWSVLRSISVDMGRRADSLDSSSWIVSAASVIGVSTRHADELFFNDYWHRFGGDDLETEYRTSYTNRMRGERSDGSDLSVIELEDLVAIDRARIMARVIDRWFEHVFDVPFEDALERVDAALVAREVPA